MNFEEAKVKSLMTPKNFLKKLHMNTFLEENTTNVNIFKKLKT